MGARDTLGAGSETVSPGLCSARMQSKGTNMPFSLPDGRSTRKKAVIRVS